MSLPGERLTERPAESALCHTSEGAPQHIREGVQRREEHFCFRGVNYRLVVWEPVLPDWHLANKQIDSLSDATASRSDDSAEADWASCSDTLAETGQSVASTRRADPILLLHGFAQSADTWNEVAPALALGGFICDPTPDSIRTSTLTPRLVVALDLVGHGKSDRPEAPEHYSFAEVTAMLRALIEQRLGGRAVLIGYSMGGRIALVYACEGNADTLSALVLESASLGPATPDEREQARQSDARLIERLKHSSITDFVDYWETLPLFATQQNLPETLRQSVRTGRLANSPAALARSVEGMGKHAMPYCAEHMKTLQIPLLFISGILDKKYSAFTKMFRNMDLVTCTAIHSGHNTHLENPKRFVQCIADFLEAKKVV